MKPITKNKKAMMSIAIVILAVSTLVLVISALFIFNSKQATIEKEIGVGSSLNDLYIQEQIMNFYLDDMCSKVQSTVNPSVDFMTELKRYKNSDGSYIYLDLEQIEKQVNEQNVKYDIKTNLLNVRFNILLSQESEINSNTPSSLVKSSYNYIYTCSRKL